MDHTNDTGQTVEVCPDCDSASIALNNTGGVRKPRGTRDEYRCNDCNATFDEPDRRPRQKHSRGGSALAARLSATPADDVLKEADVDA